MSGFDMTPGVREVREILDQLRLEWIHEYPALIYDQTNRPRIWTPDFYLPLQGVYIEVYANNSQDNARRKNTYGKNKIQIIFIHQYKPAEQWISHLILSLNKLNQRRRDEMGTATTLATSLGHELGNIRF